MEKNLQNIDDIFKEAFQLYEEQPAASVWNRVVDSLDKEEVADHPDRPVIWKKVAVILILILNGLLTYDVKNSSSPVSPEKVADTKEEIPALITSVPLIKKSQSIPPVRYELDPLKLAVSKPVLISDSLLSNGHIALHTIPQPAEKKPWSITAFASNDWAEYKLDNDAISSREKHEPSVSIGIMAEKLLTKHLGVKTGLVYSNTAIMVDPQEMYAQKIPDGTIAYKYVTSSGYAYVKPSATTPVPGDSIKATTAQHNLHVLSIPLMLTYRFVRKKLNVSPGVGISANLIAASNIKTEIEMGANNESVTIHKLEGKHTLYAGLVADLNIQYNYNDRWGINVLPSFRYAITPITKDNAAKTYPFSYNIGGGVTYKF